MALLLTVMYIMLMQVICQKEVTDCLQAAAISGLQGLPW